MPFLDAVAGPDDQCTRQENREHYENPHSAPFSSRQTVGLGGLEPPTSSLSAKRSNHLSYRPVITWGRGTRLP